MGHVGSGGAWAPWAMLAVASYLGPMDHGGSGGAGLSRGGRDMSDISVYQVPRQSDTGLYWSLDIRHRTLNMGNPLATLLPC